MIATILLFFTLIFMGFCIGFVIGAEWIKKQWTSKIPRRVYHNNQWYLIDDLIDKTIDERCPNCNKLFSNHNFACPDDDREEMTTIICKCEDKNTNYHLLNCERQSGENK